MIKVSIIGGSGYAGGELLRILLNHPKVKIKQVTSRRFVSQPISSIHPNLKGRTNLLFSQLEKLEPCDLLYVSLPNGKSMSLMDKFIKQADRIIDLGADFRLSSKEQWHDWYGTTHQAPAIINKFIYGVSEIRKYDLGRAKYVAGPGCEAIVSILSLWPLIRHNVIDRKRIIIDAKMGSSQAGSKATSSSHHPERSGVVRSYMPTGHRHTAEIEQELTIDGVRPTVLISATAVEMVRGVLVTIHTFLTESFIQKESRELSRGKTVRTLQTRGERKKSSLDYEKNIFKIYRKEYKNEPFIRIVKQRSGLYRFPEPKILQGTNYCDIGFEIDSTSNRLVVIGAIDNLVKGTAGNAVQCMNLMLGLPETLGLNFSGLHPI